jgi:TP901 family phage tail tape measure protein
MLELEKLLVKLMMDATQYDKVLGGAVAKMQHASKKMTQMGTNLMIKVTLPLMIMAGVASTSFASFDKAMTESLAIMSDITPDIEKQMRDQAMALSDNGAKSSKELAESYYFLASAGLTAKQSIGQLPVVTRFAAAGAFDMATATDLLTDAQTALGIQLDETGRNMQQLGDHIMLAARQANASVQQFSESITADAGVAARNFGMDVETLMAVLGAYASSGKKGAESGNMLGRATRLLTKAYRENGEVFKKYGVNVVDDATGQYRNFIDIVGDLERSVGAMPPAFRDAALEEMGFMALQQKAILPLIGMTEQMKEWERAQLDAAGTTQEVVDNQMKSFSKQMTVLKNQIQNAAIVIGQNLAPAIGWVTKKFAALAMWYRNLGAGTQKVIVWMGMFAAALGPVLIAGGATIGMVAKLITVYGVLGPVILKTVGYFKTLQMTMLAASRRSTAAFLGMRGGIIAAAAAITYFVAKLVYNAMPSIKAFKAATSEFETLGDRLLGAQRKRIEGVIDQSNKFGNLTKVDFLQEQVARATVELKGMEGQLHSAKSQYEELNTGWKNFVGHKQLERANKELDFAQQRYDTQINLINQLKEEMSRPSTRMLGGEAVNEAAETARAMEDASKAAAELVDQLTLESKTFGMSSRAAEIHRLALLGVSNSRLVQLRLLDKVLSAKERVAKLDEEYKQLMEDQKRMLDISPQQQFVTEMNKLWTQFRAGGIESPEFEAGTRNAEMQLQNSLMSRHNELLEEGRKLTEKHQKPSEIMAGHYKRLSGLLHIGAIDLRTYREEMKELTDTVMKDTEVVFRVKFEGGDSAEEQMDQLRFLQQLGYGLEQEQIEIPGPIFGEVPKGLEVPEIAKSPEMRAAQDVQRMADALPDKPFDEWTATPSWGYENIPELPDDTWLGGDVPQVTSLPAPSPVEIAWSDMETPLLDAIPGQSPELLGEFEAPEVAISDKTKRAGDVIDLTTVEELLTRLVDNTDRTGEETIELKMAGLRK